MANWLPIRIDDKQLSNAFYCLSTGFFLMPSKQPPAVSHKRSRGEEDRTLQTVTLAEGQVVVDEFRTSHLPASVTHCLVSHGHTDHTQSRGLGSIHRFLQTHRSRIRLVMHPATAHYLWEIDRCGPPPSDTPNVGDYWSVPSWIHAWRPGDDPLVLPSPLDESVQWYGYALDAGHCHGSLMFLFLKVYPSTRRLLEVELYLGEFRWTRYLIPLIQHYVQQWLSSEEEVVRWHAKGRDAQTRSWLGTSEMGATPVAQGPITDWEIVHARYAQRLVAEWYKRYVAVAPRSSTDDDHHGTVQQRRRRSTLWIGWGTNLFDTPQLWQALYGALELLQQQQETSLWSDRPRVRVRYFLHPLAPMLLRSLAGSGSWSDPAHWQTVCQWNHSLSTNHTPESDGDKMDWNVVLMPKKVATHQNVWRQHHVQGQSSYVNVLLGALAVYPPVTEDVLLEESVVTVSTRGYTGRPGIRSRSSVAHVTHHYVDCSGHAHQDETDGFCAAVLRACNLGGNIGGHPPHQWVSSSSTLVVPST